MGNATTKSKAEEGLDEVVKSAAKRLGTFAVTGRYHKLPKKLTDDYKVQGDVLGSGYNGSVYKAVAKEGGHTFAVKDFKLRNINKEKMEELEGECEIFLSMDHPHVARLVDVYQNDEKLSLVMECMEGGELFDRVLARKKFSEKDCADATYQMLLALNYIHATYNIVHRDIKLENFLYEKKDTDHLKLIDFGFSKIWDQHHKMKMSCGTLAYVAPEVLQKSYTDKCDMWSLGVVVFILLVGYMPFSGAEDAQMRNIKQGKFLVKPAFNKISEAANDFVRKLIVVDVNARLSAEDALKHAFITTRSDLSKHAEGAEVDSEIVNSLQQYAQSSKFRRAVLNGMAWSLTCEERTILRDSFLAMDKEKTGVITLAEFKSCIDEKFDLDDAEVKSIFESIDSGNTDLIHYTEFLAAMVATRVQMNDELLKATFRRFDTGKTGDITIEDLRAVLGDTYEGEHVEDLLKQADANGDGKISYQEFIEFAKDPEAGHHVASVGEKIIDTEMKKQAAEPPTHGHSDIFKPFKVFKSKLGVHGV